jgi:hypothetical protein
LSAHTRKLLWLAAWVMGFAIAMACMLLTFKHRAALEALQRDRLERVSEEIAAVVTRNLAVGLALPEIASLPDFLDSQKSTEDLVKAIDVVDAEGRVLYSTQRKGASAETSWRSTIALSKDRPWHASEGIEAAVGEPIRNAFGMVVGHVVVRYSLESLDTANRNFARHLAAWGAAIAVASTLLVFSLLWWERRVLEGQLARARVALRAAPSQPPDPESLIAEATAARLAIEDAGRELDIAQARLVAEGRAT